MSTAVARELRIAGALTWKEARDARAIVGCTLLAVACAAVTINALWDLSPGALERGRREVWLGLAALACLPVLADGFTWQARGAGTAWARPLPVRTWCVFASRAAHTLAFAVCAFATAAIADLFGAHLFHDSEWRVEVTARFLSHAVVGDERFGVTVLALGTVVFVGMATRHALAAACAGLAVLAWCSYCLSEESAPIAGHRLGSIDVAIRTIVIPLAAKTTSAILVLIAAGLAFSLRGVRARSAPRRVAVLAFAAASAGAASFSFADDPLGAREESTFFDADTGVLRMAPSPDGTHTIVTLFHDSRRPNMTTWVIDTRTAERMRLVVPGELEFGAVATLVDVDSPRWLAGGDLAGADFGRYVDLGPWGTRAGTLAHDLATGRTGIAGTPDFRAMPPEAWWVFERVETLDDGSVRDRWRFGGDDRGVESVRREGGVYWMDGKEPRRVAYIGGDDVLKHLDLETGVERDVSFEALGEPQNVRLSRHQERWIRVLDREGRWHLVDTTTGVRHVVPRDRIVSWTRRPEAPLLLRRKGDAARVEEPWLLLGEDGTTPLRLEKDVQELHDLDGERWLGKTRGRGPGGGGVYVFGADGRVLVELRAENGE